MRKWGNGEMERRHTAHHFDQQTTDVSLLQSPCKSDKKSMSIYWPLSLIESPSLPYHSIMVCKLALCIFIYSTFDCLLAFLKFVESLNCSYFVPTSTIKVFGFLHCYGYVYRRMFVSYVQHYIIYNRRECTTALYLCETNIVNICTHSMQFFAIAR